MVAMVKEKSEKDCFTLRKKSRNVVSSQEILKSTLKSLKRQGILSLSSSKLCKGFPLPKVMSFHKTFMMESIFAA